MNTAELRLKLPNPDVVYKALEPEITGTKRFKVKISPEKEVLKITVDAQDVTALKAAINSYLRLVELASNVREVE
jgi:KEOPS complex subunit Pcc1